MGAAMIMFDRAKKFGPLARKVTKFARAEVETGRARAIEACKRNKMPGPQNSYGDYRNRVVDECVSSIGAMSFDDPGKACDACEGNVRAGKHCWACGLEGPAGQGHEAT
ncbi:hypothetical protein LCGC14_0319770 [marine sediment metagenome]|uniref:Uncharacterized protein n=1 Tax=marine sediment metagenome TaxID=412755 RepID=A0A0F9TPY1_9ZZZZ